MSGDEDTHPDPGDEVIITVPADLQAGVWANWAAIDESDHAFRESRTNTGQPAVSPSVASG